MKITLIALIAIVIILLIVTQKNAIVKWLNGSGNGTGNDLSKVGTPTINVTVAGGGNSTGQTSGQNGVSGNNLNGSLVLKKGVKGAEVKELQRLLNIIEPANPLVEDGKFGPLTETKLKKYNNGIGSITLNDAWNKIKNFTPSTNISGSSSTASTSAPNWWDYFSWA